MSQTIGFGLTLHITRKNCKILVQVDDKFLTLEELFNQYRGPEAAKIADDCIKNSKFVYMIED